MKPEDLQKIQDIVDGAVAIEPWLIVLIAIVSLIAGYIGAYLKEKGKNVATKEDVDQVTRKIEEVKAEVAERDRIAADKYQQKREACLNMMSILDAHLSHAIKKDNKGNYVIVDKQYSDIESARKCHNDLLLSVDDGEITRKYLSIILGKSKRPIEELDGLRANVRKELGYQGTHRKDTENTWIGTITFKEND